MRKNLDAVALPYFGSNGEQWLLTYPQFQVALDRDLSQNVNLALSPHLENLSPLIEQNHLYIRIASNDFFAVSRDVVSKMITGENYRRYFLLPWCTFAGMAVPQNPSPFEAEGQGDSLQGRIILQQEQRLRDGTGRKIEI